MQLRRLNREYRQTEPLAPPANCGDLRFRALLSAAAWHELSPAVRARFSKRLTGGAAAIYRGQVVETRMSRLGRLLAEAGRLIGGPLPLRAVPGMPAIVAVTEDAATNGQFWTRIYGRPRGFPQTIQSSKRFQGATGLEEYVGRGVGMALTIRVEAGALLFESTHYFLELGRLRLILPRWLSPGRLTVAHRPLDDRHFEFSLDIQHPLAGEILHQTAVFTEDAP